MKRTIAQVESECSYTVRDMIGGNEANLKLISYPENKVRQLASLAHDLGVVIHIQGIPFGALDPHELLTQYCEPETK